MTPEQMFEQLLRLGTSWKVVRTEFEAERNTFVICVSETQALRPEEAARPRGGGACGGGLVGGGLGRADEMNQKKGHNYLTVFADLIGKRVLFGTEGKDVEVWGSFAQELQAHNGHSKAITQVAIDMSPAYIKGARENFGNATLVFDKFHVIPEANEGVEAVWRLEVQQDELKAQQLAKSQWIFRKNP